MANLNKKLATNTVTKSLKYSVITTFVNFDANKHQPNVIIVNGMPAIKLKKNIYTKL